MGKDEHGTSLFPGSLWGRSGPACLSIQRGAATRCTALSCLRSRLVADGSKPGLTWPMVHGTERRIMGKRNNERTMPLLPGVPEKMDP